MGRYSRHFQHIRSLNADLRDRNSELGNKLALVPIGEWPESKRPPFQVWRSRKFLVQEYAEGNNIRISVTDARQVKGFRTIDGEVMFGDGITWDDLQQIKNEIGYSDQWAVEIFPPVDEVVNHANMRHLWVLPTKPNYGWHLKKGDN